jgi:hypothetical protein
MNPGRSAGLSSARQNAFILSVPPLEALRSMNGGPALPKPETAWAAVENHAPFKSVSSLT